MRSRCRAGQQSANGSFYSNTNGSPSTNSALTMITLTEPTSPVAILGQNFVMAV